MQVHRPACHCMTSACWTARGHWKHPMHGAVQARCRPSCSHNRVAVPCCATLCWRARVCHSPHIVLAQPVWWQAVEAHVHARVLNIHQVNTPDSKQQPHMAATAAEAAAAVIAKGVSATTWHSQPNQNVPHKRKGLDAVSQSGQPAQCTPCNLINSTHRHGLGLPSAARSPSPTPRHPT